MKSENSKNDLIQKIAIQDIKIPEVLSKLYDSVSKADKINELKESIREIGQQQPIVVINIQNQIYLIDGKLRLLAMEDLKLNEISVIFSPFDPYGEIALEDFILQHHIRKELTLKEKINEIRQVLRIDEEDSNPNRDIDKRRKAVSLKLGNKFKRNNVIDLEKILRFEKMNKFELDIAEKIIDGQLKVANGKDLIQIIEENDYTPDMEKDSKIIYTYLKGEYDLGKTDSLIKKYMGKVEVDNSFITKIPQKTDKYEIRSGNILNTNISDITFDVIFSSPPYYTQRTYGNNKEDEIGKEKTRNEYIKHIADAFEKGYNQLSDRGSMFVNINDTYQDGFSLNIIESFVIEMEKRGIHKVDCIFWEKKGAKPSSNNVHRLYSTTEYIIHFAKSKDYVWNPIGKLKDSMRITKSCSEVGSKKKGYTVPNRYSILSNVLRDNTLCEIDGYTYFSDIIKTNIHEGRRKFEKGEEKHDATFNCTLPIIPLLLTCPRDKECVVGDIFAGTSSTGEVALALGHKYVGVELYQKNIDVSSRVLYQTEQENHTDIYSELFETSTMNVAA